MTKTEMLAVLARYLPPDVLSAFMKAWWQSGLEAQANGEHFPQAEREGANTFANGLENADKEPRLEDCEWCHSAHLLGTTHLCPLNPAHNPVAAYQAMEAALQLLVGNILNMRTELLAIKAEIMKEDELEYEDTRKYMEHHYEGGE